MSTASRLVIVGVLVLAVGVAVALRRDDGSSASGPHRVSTCQKTTTIPGR